MVDTDVLIDFLRGHPAAVTFITSNANRILISAIVAAELYAGVKGQAEEVALSDLLSLFRQVPIELEIAKKGGLYKRDFGRSHGVGLADAILAASANLENAELKTLNVKHYPMLKGIKPAYTK
jgi:predicted nucleic acid-binding protein